MLYVIVLMALCMLFGFFFFFKQKTAYEMRISDWSSDVCSSDLVHPAGDRQDRYLRANPLGVVVRAEGRRAEARVVGQAVVGEAELGDEVRHVEVAEMLGNRGTQQRAVGILVDRDRKSTRLNSSH